MSAPGEFARAYVIAPEVGHHVRRFLGYAQRVDAVRGMPPPYNYAPVVVGNR